ncbi:YggS family pyridoxal phosphate-dependent enzyme [Marinobacter sp. X15-166B]|uniref:YggS family pyridoxal phosphate-dependent enzyme n=1 Tax=Marinobacter sp. X15-166B TaxID=1897620 RepID=UPI00085C0358|nr:YggS family pyridoxal phosphate-dependent enzyme [Marinobacter sp. X15-166B]OEY66482.1 YggS family pyridoxal phosphate enzyme [Marinobacter sp. X15-166B]
MSSIADNIESVTRRIQKATVEAGRDVNSVRLLAVSKSRPAAEIRAAVAAEQYAFGENYVQEACDKMAELADLTGIEWHFIGPVQANKTRQIAENFAWVHSVDRFRIAGRLSSQRPPHLPPLNVCIQVNINAEDSKSGCSLSDLPELAEAIIALPGLRLRGLMALPAPAQSEDELRASFRHLADLQTMLNQTPSINGIMDTLSMGMSADLELAIAEGATWVRIGTALFGKR